MKKTKLTLIYILLVITFGKISAQVTLEWVARYNSQSNGSDYVKAMAVDSMGNVYVAGTDADSPPGFVTIKISTSGQIVWARRYLGAMPITAGPKQIAVDRQGNVYVGASDVDYIVIKYDSSGVEQWVRRFRGSGGGINSLNDLATEDSSMSIIHTGYATFNSGFSGCFTIRSNYSTGDSVWSRRYTPNPTICGKIYIDLFKNINVNGVSNIAVLAPDDFLTLSYDLDGNLRWAQTWNGPGNRWDVAADIASDKNGNVYVTGYATMDSTNAENVVTIKYDSNGNQKWIRFYDGSGQYFIAHGEFIKIDPLGNVIVAGWQAGYNYDFCTIKYDSLGNKLWVQGYNGAANEEDFLEGLTVDKLGCVYVTGSTKDIINLPKITTIKYDKDGNQKWIQKYPDYDTISYPAAIIVDNNLNVYIAGEIGVAGYNNDIIVLKYSQPTSVVPILSEVPDGFKLYQNYPNPFNSKTDLRFEIPAFAEASAGRSNFGFVSLKVYDVFGREVATLVNEKKEPGEYQVEWDAEGLASGVYYYRMISGKNIETKKALLIK